MTPFPGCGTPIPTIMSLDPQSDALTERSRNYYAHAQAGKPRPGRRRRACPCVQRAAAGPEPERGPRFAGPGRWFEKPQRWVSGGRQTYLVSARDLGTSHTLPRSREAHLTSLAVVWITARHSLAENRERGVISDVIPHPSYFTLRHFRDRLPVQVPSQFPHQLRVTVWKTGLHHDSFKPNTDSSPVGSGFL